MSKYVILHGHFYQPPREDPWMGIIERQKSAAPYSDWNKRITAECYAACTASRVLDDKGRIDSIVNLHEYLSFNYGPTLLSWMEKEAPNVYQRILEADKVSLERLGWGNAVAQAFNHTILPLDSPENAETQVIWGLEDFSRRFNRDADGMWLPECAVNELVLDILIRQGLKYVILSPWQADALVGSDGTRSSLDGNPAPSDRPFMIRRPGGSIAAFFYHPGLASRISFGHLLQSKEGFSAALNEALGDSPMVSIATDGEIYGHHEPFGDMCLAAYTADQESSSAVSFTNFAAYLAENPPIEEIEINLGDDGLGSSWSCAHGVGRWMRHCGCSTGGDENWTQNWREPLRAAFNNLKAAADPLWAETVQALTGRSSREVLNDYGRVLSGRISPAAFASENLLGDVSAENSVVLLEALEGAKYLQYTYTSCGWFFSELTGIEPVQNLRYAYRAAELLDPEKHKGLIEELRDSLAEAESNIQGTGADILETEIAMGLETKAVIAALFFWRHLYSLSGGAEALWGDWKGLGLTKRIIDTDSDELHLGGEISFEHVPTSRNFSLRYEAAVDGRLFCPEVTVLTGNSRAVVPIKVMPAGLKAEIQKTLLKRSEKKLKKFLGSQAIVRLRDLKMVKELGTPFGASGWQTLELSLHYGPALAIDRLRKAKPKDWDGILEVLEELMEQRSLHAMDSDSASLEDKAGRLVSRVSEKLLEGRDKKALGSLVRFLEILHRHGIKPLKPFAQNAVYELLEMRFSRAAADYELKKSLSDSDLKDLAELMNINPSRFLIAQTDS